MFTITVVNIKALKKIENGLENGFVNLLEKFILRLTGIAVKFVFSWD